MDEEQADSKSSAAAGSEAPTASGLSTSKGDKRSSMNVDTSMPVEESKGNKNPKQDSNRSNRSTNPSPALSSTGTGQDMHPYARSSVIEVWHVDSSSNSKEDDSWWSEPDSSEDDEAKQKQRTVRLCDIIDRAQTSSGSWRYYVHYRDFNRRMDEWITGMFRTPFACRVLYLLCHSFSNLVLSLLPQ